MKIISSIILVLIVGCNFTVKKNNTNDYDALCIVGKHYDICSSLLHDASNPFDTPYEQHEVIITKKVKGYVQYKYPDQSTAFSRSCKEFIEMVNECNKYQK